MTDLPTAAGAAVVFAATNVDDMVVLTVLFVAARTTGRPRRWQIVAGQYAGITALVAAAAVVAARLHPRVVHVVQRAGHWLAPVIFMAIGVVILVGSGVVGHLVDLLG